MAKTPKSNRSQSFAFTAPTAFHRAMPRVERLLPVPCRYEAQGVHR